MSRAVLKLLSALCISATCGLHALPTAAQNAPKPFDPDKSEPEAWMNLPEIIPFANADGSVDIAWRDYSATPPKIYLTRFSATAGGYARIGADTLPSLGLLCGFTKDAQGNVYHMTAEKGDGETQKRIILYKNKQPFWNFMMQDGDNPPQLPKLPCDNGTSQIVTGAGKLFLDINLLPSHAYNVLLDLDNPAANAGRAARETLWHHNLDQRVLFDGTDFIAVENRDHEVTLSMMKFSPTEKYPFEGFHERLRSVYTRTNNGNSVFTELGDIAPGVGNSSGYLMLFASERDWDDQMEGLTKRGEQTGLGGQVAPRDLAVIHVKKDFNKEEPNWKDIKGDWYSQAPKMVDTTAIVNSIGTGKITTYHARNDGWDWPNYNADIAREIANGALAARQRKTAGVNWLTSYGVPFENTGQLPEVGKQFTTVVHPKLVRLASNSYIAIWEEWKGARATWDKLMTDKTYATTKAMTLTLAPEGDKVRINAGATKDLGKIRVMAYDDAFALGGKAAWVTGDETNKSLKLNMLDAALNLQSFLLPLSGAANGIEIKTPEVKVAVNPQPNSPIQANTAPLPNPDPQPNPQAAPQIATAKLDTVAIDFADDWTTTRDDKAKLITSMSPDKTARLLLKVTTFKQYDPLQEKMAGVIRPLLPDLHDLKEVDTQHDVFRGGLGLRIVTYTANMGGKRMNIIVEFAKPPTEDAAPTVILIHVVEAGVTKHDKTIEKISQSLRHVVN